MIFSEKECLSAVLSHRTREESILIAPSASIELETGFECQHVNMQTNILYSNTGKTRTECIIFRKCDGVKEFVRT